MTEPVEAELTELIAVNVAHRFQGPPRVVVIMSPIDVAAIWNQANHAMRISVYVQTHFGSAVRGEVLHGYNSVTIEAILHAVNMALDHGLQQLHDQGHPTYLTDPNAWYVQELDEFYQPPDWFGTDTPDFTGEEDG